MKKTAAVTVTALLTLPLWPANAAQGDLQFRQILLIAKMAGACGVMDSMIDLQKTTGLPGGDTFVTRMWGVEAARLGVTVEQLSGECDKSTAAYQNLWQAAGEMDAQD